jgi:hypothetical protein
LRISLEEFHRPIEVKPREGRFFIDLSAVEKKVFVEMRVKLVAPEPETLERLEVSDRFAVGFDGSVFDRFRALKQPMVVRQAASMLESLDRKDRSVMFHELEKVV